MTFSYQGHQCPSRKETWSYQPLSHPPFPFLVILHHFLLMLPHTHPLPEEATRPSSTGHTRSGTSYHPESTKLCPLRKAVNERETETLGVRVTYSMTDHTQYKIKLGCFPEDPNRFTDTFQTLMMSFNLTWRDMQVVISTCCTLEEKQNLACGSGPCG